MRDEQVERLVLEENSLREKIALAPEKKSSSAHYSLLRFVLRSLQRGTSLDSVLDANSILTQSRVASRRQVSPTRDLGSACLGRRQALVFLTRFDLESISLEKKCFFSSISS